jgi:hypothetical protein
MMRLLEASFCPGYTDRPGGREWNRGPAISQHLPAASVALWAGQPGAHADSHRGLPRLGDAQRVLEDQVSFFFTLTPI